MKTWDDCMKEKGNLDEYSNYGGSTDHKNLLVFLGRNRDSDLLTISNFETALKLLGGERKAVQVHRFNHWACGWIELILISPKAKGKIALAEKMLKDLENYPVLDDDDFSRRESEAIDEAIDGYAYADFLRQYGIENIKPKNVERIKSAIREVIASHNPQECLYDYDEALTILRRDKVIIPFDRIAWEKSKGQGFLEI